MMGMEWLNQLADAWAWFMVDRVLSSTLLCIVICAVYFRFQKFIAPSVGVILFSLVLVKCVVPFHPYSLWVWNHTIPASHPVSAVTNELIQGEKDLIQEEKIKVKQEIQSKKRNTAIEHKQTEHKQIVVIPSNEMTHSSLSNTESGSVQDTNHKAGIVVPTPVPPHHQTNHSYIIAVDKNRIANDFSNHHDAIIPNPKTKAEAKTELNPASITAAMLKPIEALGSIRLTLPSFSWTVYVLFGWAVSAALLLLRWMYLEWKTFQLIQSAQIIEKEWLPVSWEWLQEASGVRHEVTLKTAHWVSSPFAAGIFKPSIYLPSNFYQLYSHQELQWIVLHELAHVRRCDPLMQLLQTCIQTVFFFHPAVWFANRMINRLREFACDEAAVHGSKSPRALCGEGLMRVVLHANNTTPQLSGAVNMVHSKQLIKERLMRILHPQHTNSRFSIVIASLFVITSLFCLPFGVVQLQAQIATPQSVLQPTPNPVPNPQPDPQPNPEPHPFFHFNPEVEMEVPDVAFDIPEFAFDIPPIDIQIPHLDINIPPIDVNVSTIANVNTNFNIDVDHDGHFNHFSWDGDGENFFETNEPGEIRGVWTGKVEGDKLNLDYTYRYDKGKIQTGKLHEDFQTQFPSLSTLTESSQNIQVAFDSVHDAGTLSFTGNFDRGLGSGQFTFKLNDTFTKTYNTLGYGDITNRRQFFYALHDLKLSFIEYLKNSGYPNLTEDELFEFCIFGVDEIYIESMKKLGFADLPAKKLIETKIHGVKPEYIQYFRDAGFKEESVDDYVEMKIHGVTPERYEGYINAGYKEVGMKELMQLCIHGVTPEYIKTIKDAGYADIPLNKYVEMKIHGISPEYMQELANSGYKDLSANKLIEMKIHGISTDFIKKMAEYGFTDLKANELIQMRIHNVKPEMANALVELGFEKPSANKLAELSIHGVNEEYIKAIAELGFKDISLNKLVEFKIHGVKPERIKQYHQLGYQDVTPNELVQMQIHNITPEFVEEANREAGKTLTIRELVDKRIHNR